MKTLDLNFLVGRMEGSQLRVVSKIFLSFRNQGKDGHPEGGGVHPHIKIRDFEAKHPKSTKTVKERRASMSFSMRFPTAGQPGPYYEGTATV